MKFVSVLLATFACSLCTGSSLTVSGVVLTGEHKPNPGQLVALLNHTSCGFTNIPAYSSNLISVTGDMALVDTTDDNGTFSFTGIKEGSYIINVLSATPGNRENGMTYMTVPLVLSHSNVTNVTLQPESVSYFNVNGYIKWKSSGMPVQAELYLSQDKDSPGPSSLYGQLELLKPIVTDDSGAFTKNNVPPGDYIVFVKNLDPSIYGRRSFSFKVSIGLSIEPISDNYRLYLNEIGFDVLISTHY